MTLSKNSHFLASMAILGLSSLLKPEKLKHPESSASTPTKFEMRFHLPQSPEAS